MALLPDLREAVLNTSDFRAAALERFMPLAPRMRELLGREEELIDQFLGSVASAYVANRNAAHHLASQLI